VAIEPAGLEIDRLFEAMVKLNGSDLHLKVRQAALHAGEGLASAAEVSTD
jgi:hypothetical protein